jgi:ribosomal-protein-alanine N-acetyltransferase
MGRVILQRAVWSDADDLIGANRANTHYHRPWVEPFTDRAGFELWFARGLTGPHVGLVARESVSRRIVGVINLNEIVCGAFFSAYLGYYGMSEFRGTGMMSEALAAAAGLAFGDLGLHRLEVNIQPDNTASIALVRRAGFRKEGFSPSYLRIDGKWRDHERWALLADDATPLTA